MWGERGHRKEWVGEGSQVVSSRGHNKFTSRSHRPFRKVHACAWGDGETRTAITGEISLLDCVLCMGQSFPIRGQNNASLGISVDQWACSSVSCEDSILMRGDLYSCESFWKDVTFQVPDAAGACVYLVEYHPHLFASPSGLHTCVSFWRLIVVVTLQVHGEVADSSVDIFDRERVFIETVLEPLVRKLPQLRIVMEHITTKDAVDFISSVPEGTKSSKTLNHWPKVWNRKFIGPLVKSTCIYLFPNFGDDGSLHFLMLAW